MTGDCFFGLITTPRSLLTSSWDESEEAHLSNWGGGTTTQRQTWTAKNGGLKNRLIRYVKRKMSRSQDSVEVSCCGLSCWVSSHTNARNYKLHTRSHVYVNTRAAAHSRKAAIQHLVPWQIKQLSISWKIYCVCRTHTQTQILKASEDDTQNTQSVNTGATHTLPNTVSITLIAVCLSKAVTEPPTFPLSWIHTISLHLSCTHTHTHTHSPSLLPHPLRLSIRCDLSFRSIKRAITTSF